MTFIRSGFGEPKTSTVFAATRQICVATGGHKETNKKAVQAYSMFCRLANLNDGKVSTLAQICLGNFGATYLNVCLHFRALAYSYRDSGEATRAGGLTYPA